MSYTVEEAIWAIQEGDDAVARRILAQMVRDQPANEEAWFWLAEVAETRERQAQYLREVLRLNPGHEGAKERLAALNAPVAAAATAGRALPPAAEPPPQPARRPSGEKRIPLWLVGLVIATIIGGGILALWGISRLNGSAERAEPVAAVPTRAQQAGVPPTYTAAPSPAATFTPLPTYTPEPTHTPAPTYTPLPTSTPYPTQEAAAARPTLAPVRQVPGNAAEFSAYIRSNYGSIAGQPLQIVDVRVSTDGVISSSPHVSIELSAAGGQAFANQPGSTAAAYTENLLADIRAFSSGQGCSLRVFEMFYTDYLRDEYFDDDWYYISDDYDLEDGWRVYRDYVWAYCRDGNDSYQLWQYR